MLNSFILRQELTIAIKNLIEMAQNITFNTFSNNYSFIFSEIHNSEKNIFDQREKDLLNNQTKIPITIDSAIQKLLVFYNEIYDINLHIYASRETETVIDIRYYLKKSLDKNFFKTVVNNKPMLHSKIDLPLQYERNKKFDINWKLK